MVHNTEVLLKWADPLRNSILDTLKPEKMPRTLKFNDTSADRDALNMQIFAEFARDRDEVTLLTKHDVLVRKDLQKIAQRCRVGNDLRT